MSETMRDEAVYKLTMPDGMTGYLGLWFSDNPAETEGCDACIGYEIWEDGQECDGGEMDYASEEKCYTTIEDALPDILEFASDDLELYTEYELTDMDLETLRETGGEE